MENKHIFWIETLTSHLTVVSDTHFLQTIEDYGQFIIHNYDYGKASVSVIVFYMLTK